MAGSMSLLADRMYYWCVVANLGYDQIQRWDIWDGGETDCSALVLFCVWEAGYMTSKPTWGNTDTLWSQLEPLGFTRKRATKANTPRGTILLRTGHVAVSMGNGMVAQASIDERGKISGGQAGDQTGLETKVSADPHNWEWFIYPPDYASGASSASPSTSTSTPSKGVKVYSFPVVKSGSKGAAVYMMQSVFNIRFSYSLALDGSCGPASTAALKAVQGHLGLTQDGSCGPLTWQAILAA